MNSATRPSFPRPDPIWEEIAGWGTAKLMKDLDNNYQLVGGFEADRQAAEEWISRFIRTSPRRAASVPAPNALRSRSQHAPIALCGHKSG